MELGLGPGRLCVRWGPRSPSPKRAEPPKFLAHVYCGQTAGWIKIILGTEVGLSPGDLVVLDGDPAPFPKKGPESSQFSAHVYCGQTAAWIRMPPGTEVGLGPYDNVLDGDPAPPLKVGSPSQIFGPCLLWPKGWVDQDGTWHGGRPQPKRLC